MVPQRLSTTLRRSASRAIRDGSAALALALSLAAGAAHAQVEDPNVLLPQRALSAPARGGTVIDPTFGVAITRLTDRGQGGGLATAEYPQLQAFNADETRILLVTEGGSRQVMDFATRQITHTGINLRLPRWSPIDQDTLYGFNRLSGGTIWLQSVELQPGGTFITTNLVNVTNLGYSTIEEGCFEELSGDGRYMTLIDEPNAQVSVLDLSTGRLRSTVRPQADVDWVAVSESGRYLAIQYVPRGTGSAQGLAIYDASNGQLLGHAADHHDHGDLGLDAIGDEVYVTMGYTNGCAGGRVACYSVAPLPAALEQGARRDLFELPPAVGSYTSCRNVLGPGFCLNGDDYASRAGSTPFARELWLTRLSDGAVKRLAHHRSSSCSYWNTARPTISRSGRYALFTSDWARPNCADQSDLYVIDLTPVLGDWIAAPTPTPVDGGVAPDASTRGDAGADAGTSADAGVRADASADAGVHEDAGSSADAGKPNGWRGGRVPPGRAARLLPEAPTLVW